MEGRRRVKAGKKRWSAREKGEKRERDSERKRGRIEND
jgi:hypothetical protein